MDLSAIRPSIISIKPEGNRKGQTGVGFIIRSDRANIVALTAAHVVREKQGYLATFYDGQTAKLHFQVSDVYWDFAVISIPYEKVRRELPFLPLTGIIPAVNSSLSFFGFPQEGADDRFGGKLMGSETSKSSGRELVKKERLVKRYQPQGDIWIEPYLPPGFSGSPALHDDKVVGLARYTHRMGLQGSPEHTTGPSSLNILWSFYNWGQGITFHTDQFRGTIDPAVKDCLLGIAKGT